MSDPDDHQSIRQGNGLNAINVPVGQQKNWGQIDSEFAVSSNPGVTTIVPFEEHVIRPFGCCFSNCTRRKPIPFVGCHSYASFTWPTFHFVLLVQHCGYLYLLLRAILLRSFFLTFDKGPTFGLCEAGWQSVRGISWSAAVFAYLCSCHAPCRKRLVIVRRQRHCACVCVTFPVLAADHSSLLA